MTALQNKDREVASMIFSLSALIRYSISISPKAVTLKDEVEIASHYLNIQKIRFDERLEYEFSIDEELLSMELPSLHPPASSWKMPSSMDLQFPGTCRLLVSVIRQKEPSH